MTLRDPTAPDSAPSLLPWWLLWVAFVIYGSLVPLDYRPLPLEVAWSHLLNAPMFSIGAEGRADWIANGVLYFPVGFFTSGVLLGSRPDAAGAVRRTLAALLGLVFGAVLAVAIECAQTAFPPRTVSLNDLVAEVIGTAIGVMAALAGTGHFLELLAGFDIGGKVLARRVALSYALVFPALALFPFDLLMSSDEWRAKLVGNQVSWWLAGSALELGGVRLTAKLAVEALAVVPLGALWSSWRARANDGATTLSAQLLRGALLGMVIEVAQLTIASGQSQGASILTRAVGFSVGASLWQARAGLHSEAVRAWLRRFSWPLLLVNALLLAVLGGAWKRPWLSVAAALGRLDEEVRFLPFYYHYYTTEMQAVVSLIAVSLSYAPLGLLGWAWGASRGAIAVAAASLAVLMEAGKLFAQDAHPDPTNIGIAAAAAWFAQSLLERLASAPHAPAATRSHQ
jgi:VanZ family protein